MRILRILLDEHPASNVLDNSPTDPNMCEKESLVSNSQCWKNEPRNLESCITTDPHRFVSTAIDQGRILAFALPLKATGHNGSMISIEMLYKRPSHHPKKTT